MRFSTAISLTALVLATTVSTAPFTANEPTIDRSSSAAQFGSKSVADIVKPPLPEPRMGEGHFWFWPNKTELRAADGAAKRRYETGAISTYELHAEWVTLGLWHEAIDRDSEMPSDMMNQLERSWDVWTEQFRTGKMADWALIGCGKFVEDVRQVMEAPEYLTDAYLAMIGAYLEGEIESQTNGTLAERDAPAIPRRPTLEEIANQKNVTQGMLQNGSIDQTAYNIEMSRLNTWEFFLTKYPRNILSESNIQYNFQFWYSQFGNGSITEDDFEGRRQFLEDCRRIVNYAIRHPHRQQTQAGATPKPLSVQEFVEQAGRGGIQGTQQSQQPSPEEEEQ